MTSVKPAPSQLEAQRFLDAIEPGGQFHFQVFAEAIGSNVHPRYMSGTLAKHWTTLSAANAAGAGVFVQINDGTSRKDKDIRRVRAYFVDLDGSDPAKLLDPCANTDILVQSSPHKFHGYWLAVDVPVGQFKRRQGLLAAHFGGDPTVCNPARVMRLPGTVHNKRDPVLTKILSMRQGL